MYGRKSSPLLGMFLRLLSFLYGAAVRLRHAAYGAGLFGTKRLPCKVVSVGNITLGGTGKTPAVIHLARLLLDEGKRPVVVSRGYGRADESGVAVVSDRSSVLLDPLAGGDEPVLIAYRLPQVPVVVGSDRFRAGTLAVERFGPDIIILDDGFQHVRLFRDLNIVLIDGTDPFGSGRLFPAGILREPLSGLKRADAVIITRADQAVDVRTLVDTVRKHTAAEIFTARHVPRCLVHIATNEMMPLAALGGAAVFAFAGIARPASLESLLRSLGADVRGIAGYPDHYRFTEQDLAGLQIRAKKSGAALLVTTEKDAVRIKDMTSGEVWALRIELEVIESERWKRTVVSRL